MKIDNETLLLDESLEDENVDELIAILSQDNIKNIQLNTKSVGPASLQVLLCHSQEKSVQVENDFLATLFESLNAKAS